MAKNNGKIQNVKKRKLGIDISVIVFLFLLIAVVAGIINRLSKSQLKIYEVMATGLAQDNVVTGLILRNEKVITTQYSGYINYYSNDAVRVSKGTLVYSLDETKEIYDRIVNSNVSQEISDTDRSHIREMIAGNRKNISLSDYNSLSGFMDDIEGTILDVYGNYSAGKVFNVNLDSVPNTFHVYYADSAGLISFNADALSGITLDSVKPDTFDLAKSFKNYTKRKSMAASGDIVMKFIMDDTWQILCPLYASQVKALSGLKSVPVTITDDGLKLNLPFEIITKDDTIFALFELEDYIQNYLDHRFISLKLNWQVSEGYKIPLSSITEKTFFIVPKAYLTRGSGDDPTPGFVRETIDPETQTASYDFRRSTIYYDDDMYYYIDAADFSAGDVLVTGDGQHFTIGITEKLEGVYNINKGYAVFRRIERITQNSDYCIVKIGTSYGISLYDHIALKASDAVDSGIIY